MKKKSITFILLFIFLVAGLAFYYGRNSIHQDFNLMGLYKEKYNDNYSTKHLLVDDFLVSNIYTDKSIFENDSMENNKNATPRVVVQGPNSYAIQGLYEVSITNAGTEEIGNIITSKTFEAKNNYLVGEWFLNYGGSSGLKGLVVFGVKEGELQPITGYPFEFKDSSINLTNTLTGKKFSFPIDTDSVFTQITDLNGDGMLDLLYADYKWDMQAGESHYQPRPWHLRAYELKDNKFQIANWWNNGQEFTTPDKIGYSDGDNQKLLNYFKSNLNPGTKNNDFYNAVVYECIGNKKVEAIFTNNVVKITLPDSKVLTLPHAESASGARFANEDESFVFWTKGDSAFIQEKGNISYQGCNVKSESNPQSN